jgi:hypothetical protein
VIARDAKVAKERLYSYLQDNAAMPGIEEWSLNSVLGKVDKYVYSDSAI